MLMFTTLVSALKRRTVGYTKSVTSEVHNNVLLYIMIWLDEEIL